MFVSLLRHGEASFDASSDANRELTELGRRQVLASVKALKRVCDKPIAAIWSSPYVRARQSADIAALELNLNVNIQTALMPENNPVRVGEWVQALDKKSDVDSILLVSHMPLVGDLVSLLVDGNLHSPIPFYTGMIAQLYAECALEGCFTITDVLHPHTS